MGSGKTTVAEVLATKYSYALVDLDKEIEAKENRKISNIFETDGEEYFRHVESKILKDFLKRSNQVISTGGGIILKEENRNTIKESGTVFWLYASPSVVYERIKDDNNRPLINTGKSKEDVIKRIESIMDARFDLYKESADVIINTDKFTPEECVEEILKEFKLLNL